MINWSEPVTFDACFQGFGVDILKLDYGYRISTAGYIYDVDEKGKAFNKSFKDECFEIKNQINYI